VSPADKTNTIILMCLAPFVCGIASFWGVFSVMATAGCGSECGAAPAIAIYLMIFSPWVLWLAFSVWAIVRLARKKAAFRGMLLGLAVETVIFVAANIVLMTTV
jgi:hypothetical protein